MRTLARIGKLVANRHNFVEDAGRRNDQKRYVIRKETFYGTY